MRKLFSFFAALTLSVGLWAQGSVITYTATEKLDEGEYIKSSNFGDVSIASHTFSNNTGTVTFSGTITVIGDAAFNSCSALQSITLPASILTIENSAFVDCSALQSITLPATLMTIGEHAFVNCEALQSITLPATLKTIGSSAFTNCTALQSITLPATLMTIGEYAFGGDELQSVTCKAIVPPTCDENAFDGMYIPLYVPAASVEAYQAADVWREFDIQALPAPAETYTRDNLSNGKFGTICLAYAVDDLEGVDATFYQLNYFDESASALYLEEVDALAAGMPYIFEAKAESFTVNLTITDEPAAADNYNGLYGALAEVVKTSDATHSYAAISNNQVNIAENGNTVTVAANRAYIEMNEVATSEQPHKAPLRAIGAPRGTATGEMRIENGEMRMNGKFIINGRLVIIREGKEYNALGL